MDSLESYYLIIIIFFIVILFCSITCSMCSKFNKQVSARPAGATGDSDDPPDIFGVSTVANQYNYPTHILVNGQLCAISPDDTFNIYDYVDNNKPSVNHPRVPTTSSHILYPVAIESEESQSDSTTSSVGSVVSLDMPPKYENLPSTQQQQQQVTRIQVAPLPPPPPPHDHQRLKLDERKS